MLNPLLRTRITNETGDASVLAIHPLRRVASILAIGSVAVIGFGLPADAHGPPGDVGTSASDLAGDYLNPQPTTRSTVNPWPKAASIVAKFKAYGLKPILESGYASPVWEANANLAGAGTDMRAVVMHDTGTMVPASKLRVTHSLNWIMNGVKSSKGKTVRASHLYVDRAGQLHVVYLGRTWHAGAGDSMFGVPANKMNGYSMGIEIESHGGGVKDLTAAQIATAAKAAGALLDVAGLPTSRAINHKDYAGRVQGKVDTAYTASWWQSRIAAARSAATSKVKLDPKAVSVSALKAGYENAHVKKYQKALRTKAKKARISLKKVNPSGATGYYGSETKALTRALLVKWKAKNKTWRTYWNKNPHTVPRAAMLTKLGLHPTQ